ncbi:MAG: polysaccharide biosynthesis protein [Clostridiaceae bacterium]|nr:polysaccharide biosynthesis protein [Clostridiaceae bacterium]
MKLNTQSILYGTLVLTAANLFVRLLGFIYRIFLSRKIGPEGMGLFQLVFPVYTLSITVAASGIPVAVSRLVAQQKALGNNKGAHQVVLVGVFLVASLSACLFAIILFNIDFISSNLLHDIRIRLALFIILPCICITGIASVLKGYFYGIKDIHPPAIAEIVEQMIRMILVTFLLTCIPSLNEQTSAAIAAFGMVIGELGGLLFLHYCYHNNNNGIRKYKSFPQVSILKKILKIAIPITLTRLITTILGSANAVLIPGRLVSSGISRNKAIAIYGILSGMVMPLVFIPFSIITALSVVIIPNLSENYALKNWASIRDKISKSILLTSTTAFSTMALLIPLGQPLGVVLYKQSLAGDLLTPIALFMIFTCLDYNLGSILNGLGMETRSAIHSTLGDILQLFLTYFLVGNSYFGIYGFVIGFILNSIVVSILHFIALIRTTGLKPDFIRWFIKPGLICLVTASAVRFLFLMLVYSGIAYSLSLIISATTGMIICITLLICSGQIPRLKPFYFVYIRK